jgi:serine/threonine-protein kinase
LPTDREPRPPQSRLPTVRVDDDPTIRERPTVHAPTAIARLAPAVARFAPTAVALSRSVTDAAGLLPTSAAERFSDAGFLGEGGMGEVRARHDAWIGRDVAVKTMQDDVAAEPAARARFLREVQIQGQLEHPAVIPVYDVALDDRGQLSLAMRKVRGLTLAEVLGRLASGDPELSARFSRRRLLTAYASMCNAVEYAHSRGVVHRDLEPANVMLGEFGEIYLLDWGIARVLGDEREAPIPAAKASTPHLDQTDLADAMGTPGYMAPEVLRGETVGKGVAARAPVRAGGAEPAGLNAPSSPARRPTCRAARHAMAAPPCAESSASSTSARATISGSSPPTF